VQDQFGNVARDVSIEDFEIVEVTGFTSVLVRRRCRTKKDISL